MPCPWLPLNHGYLLDESMKNQTRNSANNSGLRGILQALFSSSAVFILIGITVLFALIAVVSFTIYLAYGFSNTPPKSLSVPTSSSHATINWYESNLISIDSDDIEGALMALGAAHATSNSWQMYLWRQTAAGSLTEWFGPNLTEIDRFTKRLRFTALAQETYNQLPEEQARLLDAYTAGVNATLNNTKLIKQDEITLLDITPEPWQPWHTLTIERLFAWLSLDLQGLAVDSLNTELPEWATILEADLALKKWLQLHGFQHSIAGAWPADTLGNRTTLHRFVYGSSAIPLFQEVLFKIGSESELYTSTVPGPFSFRQAIQLHQAGLSSPKVLLIYNYNRLHFKQKLHTND